MTVRAGRKAPAIVAQSRGLSVRFWGDRERAPALLPPPPLPQREAAPAFPRPGLGSSPAVPEPAQCGNPGPRQGTAPHLGMGNRTLVPREGRKKLQCVLGNAALGKVGVLLCAGMQRWETPRGKGVGVESGSEFVSSVERRFSSPALELQSHTPGLA